MASVDTMYLALHVEEMFGIVVTSNYLGVKVCVKW